MLCLPKLYNLGLVFPLLLLCSGLAACSAGSRNSAPTDTIASEFREIVQHNAPQHFGQNSAEPNTIGSNAAAGRWQLQTDASAPESPAWPQLPDGSGPLSHVYLGPVITATVSFDELLLSWNITTPPGTSAAIELRVMAGPTGEWSPWLFMGDWPGQPPAPPTIIKPTTSFAGAKIDVDYFVAASGGRFNKSQYRVLVFSQVAPQLPSPVSISRITSCAMDTALADAHWVRQAALAKTTFVRGYPIPINDLASTARTAAAPLSTKPPRYSIAVPTRSQRTQKPEIAGRICSPTSVSMVLAAYGQNQSVLDVANLAFDTRHDLYGNWPRNVQTAYSLGVPGYLTRVASWREVEDLLALNWPVVISIQTKPGELRGSPYKETDGHLIVIRGIDANGNIMVNDPAVEDPTKAALTYFRDDLTTVWLKRTLGTAYVLQRPND